MGEELIEGDDVQEVCQALIMAAHNDDDEGMLLLTESLSREDLLDALSLMTYTYVTLAEETEGDEL